MVKIPSQKTEGNPSVFFYPIALGGGIVRLFLEIASANIYF